MPLDRWRAAGVLLLYALFLGGANSQVTVFEDEASMVAAARRSVAETLARFTASAEGQHDHPPLADLFLHFWLRVAGESLLTLRAPFILFHCLALWIVAETADRLWGRRWVALALGVAWPAGYFLGRPAGWYSPFMLELAGLTWAYLGWRETGRRRLLAVWAVCAVAMVYTNYFGWVFLGVLAVDAWRTSSGRRRLAELAGALAVVVAAALPLAPVIQYEARTNIHWPFTWPVLLYSAYLAHSLLASEMAAPWTALGVVAAAAGAGLVWLGARAAASRRTMVWLAAALITGFVFGILTGKRMALFGPWLLLFLTSLWAGPRARAAGVLTGAAFLMGWLGIVAGGRWAGTHRYGEPWAEATTQVLERCAPGGVVLAGHPSFFFYLFQRVAWPGERQIPLQPVEAGGCVFAHSSARAAAVGLRPARILFVRSVVAGSGEFQPEYRLVEQLRYRQDPAAALKNRFFPWGRQPEWRIQIEIWERR